MMDSQAVLLNLTPDLEFNLSSLPGNLSALIPNGSNLTLEAVEAGKLLSDILGQKRKEIRSVVSLTIVYSIIFLTGLVGNICTCIVIARNAYMRTVTNFYLFSLAIADVLTLVFALPPELYSVWEAYPWKFGEPFCIFRAFLNETTSYASVLIITSFTVERYIAICHPIRGHRSSRQSRAIKCIISVWLISALSALPYPIHTRVFGFATDQFDHKQLSESLVCNIPFKWQHRMTYFFQISTFVFFIIPMAVITVMYLMIGMKLRKTALSPSSSGQSQTAKTAASRARRAVLRMLVAVVFAFFICWAPFHAQRLMTLYIRENQWTPQLLMIQSHLFYVSGVLYFLSCTVNPILYNLLSRKFRQAFKRTLCRCCLNFDTNSIPAFYKLKAKFVGAEHSIEANQNSCYIYPDNNIRLAKLTEHDPRKVCRLKPYSYAYPSTNETCCKNTSPTQGSTSGAHAHSDGRLHRICRHKYCSSRRGNNNGSTGGCSLSQSSGHHPIPAHQRRTIISYPDIKILNHARPKQKQISIPKKTEEPPDEDVKYPYSSVVSW